jgi:hypothetical protein
MSLDLDEETKKLWQEYRDAQDGDAAGHDYAGLAKRVRALRAKARKAGSSLHAQRLADLATYVARAKKAQLTPEQQLLEIWPGLVPAAIEAAIGEGERALASGSPRSIRSAERALRFVDQPEHLAEIAEEGNAADLAEHIPGAVVDEGMLVLSGEHEALLERGRALLRRLRAR